MFWQVLISRVSEISKISLIISPSFTIRILLLILSNNLSLIRYNSSITSRYTSQTIDQGPTCDQDCDINFYSDSCKCLLNVSLCIAALRLFLSCLVKQAKRKKKNAERDTHAYAWFRFSLLQRREFDICCCNLVRKIAGARCTNARLICRLFAYIPALPRVR